MSFESIKESIHELKEGTSSEDIHYLFDKLISQLMYASIAIMDCEVLSKLIFIDDDILDYDLIDEDNGMWQDVRFIQHEIVNTFRI